MPLSGFPKGQRLLKRADFLRISGSGQKVHTTNLIIVWKESAAVRIGITVSGKVGNAVIRNRLKRHIREFYRQNKTLFIPAEYNIIAKKSAVRLGSSDLSHELSRVLQRHFTQQC